MIPSSHEAKEAISDERKKKLANTWYPGKYIGPFSIFFGRLSKDGPTSTKPKKRTCR
jgi:hypothetical protein